MSYMGAVSRQRGVLEGRSATDAKAALRDEIGKLYEGLNALLPQYWAWVESARYENHRDELVALGLRVQDRSLDVAALESLYSDLSRLERALRAALSGPVQRKMRKMFI